MKQPREMEFLLETIERLFGVDYKNYRLSALITDNSDYPQTYESIVKVSGKDIKIIIYERTVSFHVYNHADGYKNVISLKVSDYNPQVRIKLIRLASNDQYYYDSVKFKPLKFRECYKLIMDTIMYVCTNNLENSASNLFKDAMYMHNMNYIIGMIKNAERINREHSVNINQYKQTNLKGEINMAKTYEKNSHISSERENNLLKTIKQQSEKIDNLIKDRAINTDEILKALEDYRLGIEEISEIDIEDGISIKEVPSIFNIISKLNPRPDQIESMIMVFNYYNRLIENSRRMVVDYKNKSKEMSEKFLDERRKYKEKMEHEEQLSVPVAPLSSAKKKQWLIDTIFKSEPGQFGFYNLKTHKAISWLSSSIIPDISEEEIQDVIVELEKAGWNVEYVPGEYIRVYS